MTKVIWEQKDQKKEKIIQDSRRKLLSLPFQKETGLGVFFSFFIELSSCLAREHTTCITAALIRKTSNATFKERCFIFLLN